VTHIYKLLEDKNSWYRKYLQCTEAYLSALRHAPEIAIDEIELFYGNRESLLKILGGIDLKIQEALEEHERRNSEFTTEQTTKVQYHLREKDSIIERIIVVDKELMQEIEQIRTQGAEKLKLLSKGKKALANYKSTNNHNEKIDKRV
jgi:hypothetical protein